MRSPATAARVACAARWLAERPPGTSVLCVAPTQDAADDLLRGAAGERGAAFGWHRVSLGRLAATLAEDALLAQGLVPAGRLVAEAVVARVLHVLRAEGALGRFAEVADGPGFARAVASTLEELRLCRVADDRVAGLVPELTRTLAAYEQELARSGLADRATILLQGAAVAADPAARHPLLDMPAVFLDVPLRHAAERDVVAAVCRRAPESLLTVAAGDAVTLRHLRGAFDRDAEDLAPQDGERSLARLQTHLFEDSAPLEAALDQGVTILSAPGEGRECVEIARRLLQSAEHGVPFDRMAILLRATEEYRPHVEAALDRAGVPAWYARGIVRPDPAGRAFLALLACAGEGLSARRFAEYLSLGEVPDAAPDGAPPAAPPAGERFVPPDEEMVAPAVAAALQETRRDDEDDAGGGQPPAGPDAPVQAGSLRAPRHWERLLVDAAVIGGRDRWRRRLAGLARERELDLAALDPDDPSVERCRRDLEALAALERFTLPLLDELEGLAEPAAWSVWIERLVALAARALRRPERVQSVLAELWPMGNVGPIGLAEVRLVLTRRLQELTVPPAGDRHGRVFVGPAEAARGISFDVVFVPGLAERLFPRKIAEDPILLDAARARLDDALARSEQRVAAERLLLRLAVGAARERVVLSFPRLDLDQARPRVPSFYCLEALRAAEGRLPGFAELARRAETVTETRVGWPAPRRPEEAVDDAEYDLALLEGLLRQDEAESTGTARYLVTTNRHLGRALRFRARRWLRTWTVADGLVRPGETGRAALAGAQLAARSFSPTALQNYAACPYRFFLHTVLRLAPREVPEAIEEMNPLQRGSLVHEVQFELFRRLADEGLLPVTADRLDLTRARLDDVLLAVAGRYHDELAPAIERVWTDGVDAVRADLREWLRRMTLDQAGFVPWRFELSFGLVLRRPADPGSRRESVPLDCGLTLRGSIDLVERAGDGRLRVTDHKTGKVRVRAEDRIAGGHSLQPVLYALVVEKLFPGVAVEGGRLHYCTSAGGFEERFVPLDERARQAAASVARAVGAALAEPFLPAAPDQDACRWCDYRQVCGPYEEQRAGRKSRKELAELERLRRER